MRRGRDPRDLSTRRGKTRWGHSEKAAVCKPRREVSPETNPAGTLILNFQPLELWEDTSVLFMTPSLWYFVMATCADEYNDLKTLLSNKEKWVSISSGGLQLPKVWRYCLCQHGVGNLNEKPDYVPPKSKLWMASPSQLVLFADHSGLRVKAELRPMHVAQF